MVVMVCFFMVIKHLLIMAVMGRVSLDYGRNGIPFDGGDNGLHGDIWWQVWQTTNWWIREISLHWIGSQLTHLLGGARSHDLLYDWCQLSLLYELMHTYILSFYGLLVSTSLESFSTCTASAIDLYKYSPTYTSSRHSWTTTIRWSYLWPEINSSAITSSRYGNVVWTN